MARQYFSPYRPRGPRSARLTLIWLAVFLALLWITYYVSSKAGEKSADAVLEEFVRSGKMERVRAAVRAGEEDDE
ncbi:hypothetical protein QBC42DRAFT_179120 [Cladorrhinum samala]|uniref:Transmembrane protein n=1 Tax=Cladorrhinum samala TaxID=585594 RepID=A0AAV9HP07_9PEZI|nr:hypothetical protein QBC42DRAFT_179120 [Cladorrhinum samala]